MSRNYFKLLVLHTYKKNIDGICSKWYPYFSEKCLQMAVGSKIQPGRRRFKPNIWSGYIVILENSWFDYIGYLIKGPKWNTLVMILISWLLRSQLIWNYTVFKIGYILCTINLAIVLYGWAHPHQISSFICCHEDTCADHLTRFFHLKNTELPNAAAVLKWRLILRLVGNVGISDHWGKLKQFSNDCLVTENQKNIANAAIFWTLSEK